MLLVVAQAYVPRERQSGVIAHPARCVCQPTGEDACRVQGAHGSSSMVEPETHGGIQRLSLSEEAVTVVRRQQQQRPDSCSTRGGGGRGARGGARASSWSTPLNCLWKRLALRHLQGGAGDA